MSCEAMIALARPTPGDLRSADRHPLDTAAISCLPSRRPQECDKEQKGV
jgi:hypothetical protein